MTIFCYILPKCWQGSVDICCFLQSLTFCTRTFLPNSEETFSGLLAKWSIELKIKFHCSQNFCSPLWASQINKIQPSKPEVCHGIFLPPTLNNTCKHAVRTTAFTVHAGSCHLSICCTLERHDKRAISHHISVVLKWFKIVTIHHLQQKLHNILNGWNFKFL